MRKVIVRVELGSDRMLEDFKKLVLSKYPEATFELKKGVLRIKGVRKETTVKSWKDLAKDTTYEWLSWDQKQSACFLIY